MAMLTLRERLRSRWDDSGSPEGCIKNIETHIDVLLSDEDKEAINWHPRQSVQLAVMRIIGKWHEARGEDTP